MKCKLVEERLSAYIDKEVGEEERLQIESHCEQCDACRSSVTQFVAIGSLMRQSESRVDIDAVWDKVAARLDCRDTKPITTNVSLRSWLYPILATAASLTLFWYVVRNDSSNHDSDQAHAHAAIAVDFREVIQSAKLEPRAAIEKLVSKYEGKEVDKIAAAKYLGYEPALFQSMPEGFARVSTHVLNMPCCKCSATICERGDGTSLIVFEHKDEQPVWFGNSPSIETQCSGKTCKIVEAAGQLAVSWKNEDRQLTLIGANDIAEVNQWVASMKL